MAGWRQLRWSLGNNISLCLLLYLVDVIMFDRHYFKAENRTLKIEQTKLLIDDYFDSSGLEIFILNKNRKIHF
jgi:hypothetical protein